MTTGGKMQTLSMYRVLLRVRMLYYLKSEVLGEAASQALEGVSARYCVFQPTFFSTFKRYLCEISMIYLKSAFIM